MQQNKISRDPSTLGGQDKRKTDNKSIGLTGSRGGLTGTTGLTGTKTGLTGACRESGSFSRNKTRLSFKELLAKYEKQEVIQKKEKRSDEAKDVSLSLKLQEQSVCCSHQNNCYGPFTPWFHPYFYTPMDYSRMYMQSCYIQFPPMYPNYASPQRPIVASNDLVKRDFNCSKEDVRQDSKYLQPRWCPSGLSRTQKRRLQHLRKQETMGQEVEVKPTWPIAMKKVWRSKQIDSSST